MIDTKIMYHHRLLTFRLPSKIMPISSLESIFLTDRSYNLPSHDWSLNRLFLHIFLQSFFNCRIFIHVASQCRKKQDMGITWKSIKIIILGIHTRKMCHSEDKAAIPNYSKWIDSLDLPVSDYQNTVHFHSYNGCVEIFPWILHAAKKNSMQNIRKKKN